MTIYIDRRKHVSHVFTTWLSLFTMHLMPFEYRMAAVIKSMA